MTLEQIPLVVHATHEAAAKVGGIGAVLDGILGSPAYNQAVNRSILVGPVNTWNPAEMDRLTAPGSCLRILYSSLHGREVNLVDAGVAHGLAEIERRMNVRFLYGVRSFGRFEHEVLLVDAGAIAAEIINSFKFYLWQRLGLDCSRHESTWEFSFFLNAGEPLYDALRVLTRDLAPSAPRVVVAHEWVGLPLVFSAFLHGEGRYRTVFYAHEVATARHLVESHAGHDTRFYNALRLGLAQHFSLDQVFGDQSWFYKHAMILRAGVCDRIFAVGDLVVDELRFLGGVFEHVPIDLVYNGVPSAPVSASQRLASRELMLQYAANLYGYRPDFIFTHVSRMVTSKGLWRDVRVLEHLEWTLAALGKRAVLFIVSTAAPNGRRSEDVYRWEAEYGWPVAHRGDNGDLLNAEVSWFFDVLEPFHWGRSAIKICLVNQFGWDRSRCGSRMPEEMQFADLRNGTDLEFGQSIYEPFGIAQVEPLGVGALCVVSNVCGCLGLLSRANAGRPAPTVVTADYVTVPEGGSLWTPWDALRIDRPIRDSIEARRSWEVAQAIAARLPQDDDQRRALLTDGQRVAANMTWEVIVRDYFLPAIRRTWQG